MLIMPSTNFGQLFALFAQSRHFAPCRSRTHQKKAALDSVWRGARFWEETPSGIYERATGRISHLQHLPCFSRLQHQS
jgi:hypothetical protein